MTLFQYLKWGRGSDVHSLYPYDSRIDISILQTLNSKHGCQLSFNRKELQAMIKVHYVPIAKYCESFDCMGNFYSDLVVINFLVLIFLLCENKLVLA